MCGCCWEENDWGRRKNTNQTQLNTSEIYMKNSNQEKITELLANPQYLREIIEEEESLVAALYLQ